jgi:hypothetical protein
MRYLRLLFALVVAASTISAFSGHPVQAASLPSNDRVANAKVISALPYKHTVTITGATTTSEEPKQGCIAKKAVWYKFSPEKTAAYTLATLDSTYDTRLTVYDGVPASNIANQIACQEDISLRNTTSRATVGMRQGHTYYIAVSTYDSTGILRFTISSAKRMSAALTGYETDTQGGAPEAPVSVAVHGYTTNTEFRVYYVRDGKKTLFPYGFGTVDLDGDGYRTVYVPKIPKGTYTVRAEQGWLVKTTTMTVVPHLGYSWGTTQRGATHWLYVNGFAAKEKVVVQWWDGGSWRAVTSTLTTNADGVVEKSIQVPNWAPLGAAKLRAVGSKTNADGDPLQVTGASVSGASVKATEPPATPTVAASETPAPAETVPVTATETPVEIATVAPTATETNATPVADPGVDQAITDSDGSGAESVTLDGTASADPEGSVLTYLWSEDGREVGTGAVTMVELPVGQHTITLTVFDDRGASATDEVAILIGPTPAAPGPSSESTPELSNQADRIPPDWSSAVPFTGYGRYDRTKGTRPTSLASSNELGSINLRATSDRSERRLRQAVSGKG